MTRTLGVTEDRYKIEKKLHLWKIPIVSIEQANLIAKWFCDNLNLEKVEIVFGKSIKLHGIYYLGKHRIFLYKKGLNLATLVHELAHHYSYLVYKKGGHKKEFAQSHSLMLQKTEEYLAGLKEN